MDYSLDKEKMADKEKNKRTILSQVEINTLGCGGCAIPTKLVDLHKLINISFLVYFFCIKITILYLKHERYMLHKTSNEDKIKKV